VSVLRPNIFITKIFQLFLKYQNRKCKLLVIGACCAHSTAFSGIFRSASDGMSASILARSHCPLEVRNIDVCVSMFLDVCNLFTVHCSQKFKTLGTGMNRS